MKTLCSVRRDLAQCSRASAADRVCRAAQAAALLLLGGIASATTDTQSIINPAGRQATSINSLYWFFFWVTFVIYLLVIAFLVGALIRRRAPSPESLSAINSMPPPVLSDRKGDRTLSISVGVAVAATALVLFLFIFLEYRTGRFINDLAQEPNPLRVEITGKQWWWEVKYDDDQNRAIVTTANELHLPVGRAVEVKLESTDVIHSFWLPNFAGKRDAIPGRTTSLWIKADREGTFTGQCAEFCGPQHAHMKIDVTAESPEKFEAWLAAGQQTAGSPKTTSQKRGQQILLASSCVMCHTISGTPARATIGPDLSHLASRPTIAAGTLKNNRGNLGGWIIDSQHVKPGNHMPQNNIDATNIQHLLDYLESLK